MASGVLEARKREGIEANESTLKESGDCLDSDFGNHVELVEVREHREEKGVSDDD